MRTDGICTVGAIVLLVALVGLQQLQLANLSAEVEALQVELASYD